MAGLSDETIQDLLDAVSTRFEASETFVSVEYRLPGEFVCTFIEDLADLFEAERLKATDETGKEIELPLRSQMGPSLTHQLGRVGVDPVALTVGDGRLGGDECRNANSMGYYGTIGFYCGNIQLVSSGACTINCTTAPALVSNNHVIARSDAATAGEAIWTLFKAMWPSSNATFRCAATAAPILRRRPSPISPGYRNRNVRGIGGLGGLRRPNIGEAPPHFYRAKAPK